MKYNNLLQQISIDQAKLNFVKAVLGEDATVLNVKNDSEKEDFINYVVDLVKTLAQNEQFMVNNRFGLLNGNNLTLAECGKSLNLTTERVRQIEAKAIRRLRRLVKAKETLKKSNKTFFNYEHITLIELGLTRHQQRILEDNNIHSCADLLRVYFEKGENEIKHIIGGTGDKAIIAKIKSLENFEEIQENFNQQLKQKIKNEDFNLILLGSLNLSVRTYNALMRSGLNTLQDVLNVYRKQEMDKIRNLGKESLNEIVNELGRLVDLKQFNQKDTTDKIVDSNEKTLEDLKFSKRTYNALKRQGIDLLKELIEIYNSKGIEGFYKFRGVGISSIEEIEQTLSKYIDLSNEIEDSV